MEKLKALIVDENMPTIDAMRRLNEEGRRVVFVADKSGKLLAVLTDGDVRRYILSGGELSAAVMNAANHSPIWLPIARKSEAAALMAQKQIDAVPVLDNNGILCDIVFSSGGANARREELKMPVVIMAGGLGTRLYPYTKILPKPLIPIGEVPIIERVMNNFLQYGCKKFSVIVNWRKNMIKSYFAESDKAYEIEWVEEEKPLDTGGGLSLLKGKIDGEFFLTNCDILIDADYGSIARFHKKQGNAITMVCATKEFTIPYGVVNLGEGGEFATITEKPGMNHLINTGMYLVNAEVLDLIEDNVPATFPDIIQTAKQSGLRVGVYPVNESAWMDMGQIEELDEMRRRLEKE